jgi:hypothetical protein
MRALHAISAFLLATLLYGGRADAHVPLWAPRVSLSLALDWNKLAVDAIRRKPTAKAPPRARRHQVPPLTVTTVAPPRAERAVAAYDRAQGWMRQLLIPSYVNPDVDHRQSFRQVYVVPYTPYLGAYGVILTVEENVLLR